MVVAVLDTGVAYRNWRRFTKSPDFTGTRFVAPYDFVANNRFPLDREGHGTFVAGEIAEATNNGFGLTGLAYGATIMPVRVLAADGTGDAVTIARGIRYAVDQGAQVINLSLEFGIGIDGSRSPRHHQRDPLSPSRHGVVVVAAAGNDEAPQIAYPGARAGGDRGRRDDPRSLPGLVLERRTRTGAGRAGRRRRRELPSDPDCHPDRSLPPIYQLTFVDPSNPTQVRLSRRHLRHLDGRRRGGRHCRAGDRQRRARSAPEPGRGPQAARADRQPLGGLEARPTRLRLRAARTRRAATAPARGRGAAVR